MSIDDKDQETSSYVLPSDPQAIQMHMQAVAIRYNCLQMALAMEPKNKTPDLDRALKNAMRMSDYIVFDGGEPEFVTAKTRGSC